MVSTNQEGMSVGDTVPDYSSRFAALWPFIGILAELIILLITIILYERHKAAKKKAAAAQNNSLLATSVSPSGDSKSHHSFQIYTLVANSVLDKFSDGLTSV
ncbi:Basigin [Taenia solium]|eukprot:TsM_000445100 transcript=TsM_000445100 gene=TsM_000445100